MSDIIFDYGRGVVAEKVIDGATAFGIMLLKVAEADATLKTRATLAAILAAANTEADFTNYGRKTGLTATLTTDTSGHLRKASVPDQTWTAAGGGTNNSLVKLIVYYQDAAADATRIPIVALDWTPTTDGTDLATVFNTAGFWESV